MEPGGRSLRQAHRPQRSQSLVAMAATLRAQIDGFEKRIARLVADHPYGALFRSLPGAGDVLAPRLIVVFGTSAAQRA